ncbi:MAG TPA: hypothetical protein VF633_07705 [Brevundimonas sp.]|jgi:hypothetical protein
MTKIALKIGLAVAAALILPMAGAAFAQSPATPTAQPAARPATGAAGTLPNTFDRPAQVAPTPAPATPPAVTPSDPAKVAAAETALKKTIAALQSGTPNYADMTPDLAGKVRERAETLTSLVKGFGSLNGVSHVATENGAELFLVMFANAPTQWIVGQDDEGKVTVLLFRPAPAAPPVTTPAT